MIRTLSPSYYRPERTRGHAREQARLRLLMVPVPTVRTACRWADADGGRVRLLVGTKSKHLAQSARRMRTMGRLQRFVERHGKWWWQHQCATGPGPEDFDHDFQFSDESFDHAFGTQRVWVWLCTACGDARPASPGDFHDYEDWL